MGELSVIVTTDNKSFGWVGDDDVLETLVQICNENLESVNGEDESGEPKRRKTRRTGKTRRTRKVGAA